MRQHQHGVWRVEVVCGIRGTGLGQCRCAVLSFKFTAVHTRYHTECSVGGLVGTHTVIGMHIVEHVYMYQGNTTAGNRSVPTFTTCMSK